MIRDLGTYHYFRWYDSTDDIEPALVSYINDLDIILKGTPTVVIRNAKTYAVVSSTVSTYTWTFEGQDIESTRLQATLTEGETYYLVIDNETFSNFFAKSDCCVLLNSSNSCSNIYHDWVGDDALIVPLYEAIQLEPEYTEETASIIGIYGETKKTISQKIRHRYKFVTGMGMVNMLNGIKNNDTNDIDGVNIKNIEYELEETADEDYATFTLSFEIADQLDSASSCCEVINIDDILSPETVGGDCEGFTAEITEAGGVLSVTLTSPPTGTPTYKWYLNGVYLSGASTVTIDDVGDYRVDVKVGTCKATAYYYEADPCAAFSVTLYATGAEINGDLNNLPEGETATYDIVFNGESVGSALPYTATATGTYYIYVTTESCNKSKGIYVIVGDEDCDFTIDIDEDGTELSAVTDATTPTYLWELETTDGKTTVGTGDTITMTGKGIYWLTITQGTCSKTDYIYKAPSSDNVVCVLARSTGHTFDVYEIDLGAITNPALDLEVFVNGVRSTYVAAAPSVSNTYSINSSNKLIFATALPLSNATIIIIKR